jgi:ferredoxin
LSSASYIFAIATRGGSPSIAFKDINRFIRKKGKFLDSQFYLDMPSNVIIIHALDTPEEEKAKETLLKKELELIKKRIVNKEKRYEKDPELNFIKEKILFPILGNIVFPLLGESMFSFSADSKCTGCGTCEQVCLSKKIRMKDDKPEWQKNVKCMFCFACINYCPVQSVQIKNQKQIHLEGIIILR